jgi:hypothetical protein
MDGCQALCTEPERLRGHLVGCDRRSFRAGLAQAAQFLFQRLSAPLERGNIGAIPVRRLLQAQGFRRELLFERRGQSRS